MSVPNATLWVGLVCLGAVACGARSDVQCFGGECIGGAGASTGVSEPDDDGTVVPPFMNPPRRRPVEEPDGPPPSMEMPPDEDLPVSRGSELCPNGRTQGSIVILRARDLRQLRGCIEVRGDLTISGFMTRNLTELRALERVQGTLHLGVAASLEGLESLEQVWGLTLEGLNTASLAPLGNLRLIGVTEGDPDAVLQIRNSEGFADLSGLAGLRSMRGRVRVIENPQLQSLQGLRLANSMEELEVRGNSSLIDLGGSATLVSTPRVDIEDNNQLSDITALGALTEAGVLNLEGLAIQSLDALQDLAEATSISLLENSALHDVQRLSSVQFQSLRVVRNAVLASLPEFPLPFELQQVQFRENGQLVTAPSFPNLSSASRIVISENPGITSIAGFPSLTSIGTFEVRDNPNLVELELGALQSYELARIVCNPLFPESSIASHLEPRGGELELRGNFGSLLPCN